MSLRNGNADLFTIHPDGTHVKQVTTSPGDDVLPSWAPGGAKLAFVHVSGANQQVFTIKADGTGLTKLTHSPLLKGSLAWSPNGKKIAVTEGVEENPDLYVMNADGSNRHKLPGGSSPAQDGSPGWQRL